MDAAGELSDDLYWALIGLIEPDADEPFSQLTARLASLHPTMITGFADRTAELLHALDTREHHAAAQRAVDAVDGVDPALPLPLSDDAFLYARCAVVAHGRTAYMDFLHHRRVADPVMAGAEWGELLLVVAAEAWEQATGSAWQHEEPVSYETGDNADGGR